MVFQTKASIKSSHATRRACQAFFLAATILCTGTEGFAAFATPPFTDKNLIEEAKNPAFKNVINIFMERPDNGYLCSAAKVHIPGLGMPLYLTAAHCLENSDSVKDSQGRMASAFINFYRYPTKYSYEFAKGNDFGFFVIPEDQEDNGYPLYTGNLKDLKDHSLISVGYGRMADETSPKQAFYAGPLTVHFPGAMLQQKTPLTNCHLFCSDYRSGKSTRGDSGGPLLVKRDNETYEIAGVLVRSNDISSYWDIPPADFSKTAVTLLGREKNITYNGTLINRTEEGAELMLQNPKEIQSLMTWFQSKNNLELSGRYINLIKKAALKGNGAASYALGKFYESQNNHEATVEWYAKAITSGNQDAEAQLTSYLFLRKLNQVYHDYGLTHVLPHVFFGLVSTVSSFLICKTTNKGSVSQKAFSQDLFWGLNAGMFSILSLKRAFSGTWEF